MHDKQIVEVEYDREKIQKVGTLKILDKTLADYRYSSSLNFSIHLYFKDNQQRIGCDGAAISFQAEDKTPIIPSKNLVYSIDIDSYTHVGDLNFSILLDMARVNPVYQVTTFILELSIEHNELVQQKIFQFRLSPNKEASFLVIEHERAPESQPKRLYQATEKEEPTEIEISMLDRPFAQLESGESQLLNLRLFNSATHAFGEEDAPTNKVTITSAKLDDDQAYLGLLKLRLSDEKGRPIDVTLDEMVLLPRRTSENYINLGLFMDHQTNENFFDSKRYTCCLTIKFSNPVFSFNPETETGTERLDLEEHEVVLRVSFQTLPSLGKEVVAIDYGTSAIAAYQVTKGNVRKVDLNKLFEQSAGSRAAKYDSKDASTDDLIRRGLTSSKEIQPLISNVFYRVKNSLEEEQPAFYELEFITTDSALEFEEIPLLKSRIAASQLDYKFRDGETEKTANLLQAAYRLLHQDYFCLARNGMPYRRIVVTHPNSYLIGQINFLKKHIGAAIPDLKDVQTLSESDAVIYHYLQNPSQQTNHSEDYENILCFDMGAGTLDLSFRRIQLERDKKNPSLKYVAKDQNSKLISLASVVGAGNELDEVIAMAIESKLEILDRKHAEFFDQATDNFTRFKLFQVNPGNGDASAEERAKAEKMINRMHESIRAAKAEFARDTSQGFVVKIKVEVEGVYQMVISPKFIQRLVETGHDKELGTINQHEIQIIFDFDDISKILKNYLDKHVNQPLNIVLRDEKAKRHKVHTAIISGRGALFPNIYRKVEEYFNKHCGDVNIVMAKGSPAKMKTVVAEGAVNWGRDAEKGQTLFDTPYLHGMIGLALLDLKNRWYWQPLLRGDEFNPEVEQRKSKPSEKFNSRSLRKALVLLTSIQDPKLVEQQLVTCLKNSSSEDLSDSISANDYLQLLHSFDNPQTDFERSNEVEVEIKPLLPDDPPEHYGDKDPLGYESLRVQVIVSYNDGRQWLAPPKDVNDTSIDVKKYWPYTMIKELT